MMCRSARRETQAKERRQAHRQRDTFSTFKHTVCLPDVLCQGNRNKRKAGEGDWIAFQDCIWVWLSVTAAAAAALFAS